ncbi:major facilitator superfamily domain-containing protein [Xylariomycetidae sp. FL2044]|nr:major facilitator superfamily domain-containing protein [Xylariomycetidae sp. FL2044]
MSSSSSSSSNASSSNSDRERSPVRHHVRVAKPISNDPPAWSGSTLTTQHVGETSVHHDVDESSPLLSPDSGEQGFLIGEHANPEQHDDFQKTKSIWYLLLMTVSIGGLQVAWAVELSNGSPYLLSLGLSKSLMALVWIAGPITGTLVQPYVGMLSDNCQVPWGKRKPFMLGGAAATALSLMFLAWIREIIGGFLSLFGADPSSDGVKTTIIVVAVLWIYVLDVAVNTVQASIRAFIVDCAPSHQQEAANSMASRILGVGNIIGYIAGGLNLPKYLWWFGSTQFKDLCAIASILLCSTVLLSVTFVRERNPRLEGRPAAKHPGLISFFVKIFRSIKKLPPQIYKVCVVQFFAWVGFFPMLFYTSSYIGGMYVEPYLQENPHMTPEELDDLYERATRRGTFALLIFAITSLTTNVLLPFCVDPTYDNNPVINSASGESSSTSDGKSWLRRLIIPGFTLRRAWMLSLILFAIAMFCTVLVRTVKAATILIGLVGITWALTLWAPWAIISAEISRRDVMYRARKQQMGPASQSDNGEIDPEDEPDQTGVILGIHNMAIAAPQMIATLGSSIIFRIFQKPRGAPGDHSIAIVMACGGLFVLIATYYVHKIDDAISIPEEAVYAAAEEGEIVPNNPGSPQSKRSFDQPRASMDRATLARSSSFGAGLEY